MRMSWRGGVLFVFAACVLLLLMTMGRGLKSEAEAETQAQKPEPGQYWEVTGTAYCLEGDTKSGLEVRRGIVAADPKLLPLGSIIEIDSLDEGHNGIYTVLDTGAKIRGNRIDIYIEDCDEAREFGVQEFEVLILRLGWDPEDSRPQ
jgi:3D (Asp-Asp-Asp) domain-containing protein